MDETPVILDPDDKTPHRHASVLGRMSMAESAKEPDAETTDEIEAPLAVSDTLVVSDYIEQNPSSVRHTSKKPLIIIAGIVAATAICTCLVVCTLVVSGVVGPKYSVVGIDYTKTTDAVVLQKQIMNHVSSLSISVAGDTEKQASYPFADAGITFDAAATAKTALNQKQNTSFWQRLAWWRTYEAKPAVATDKAKRADFIAAHTVRVTKQPVNATMSVDNEQVTITDGQDGVQLSVPDADTRIATAAAQGDSVQLQMVMHALPPAVTTAIAKQAKNQAEKALSQTVTFTINEETFTPTKTIIGSWVDSLDTDPQHPGLMFSKDRISMYIDQIAANYVTLPRSEIAITDSNGVKHVYVAGRNGTDITDKAGVAVAIAADLAAARPITKTLTISEKQYDSVMPQYGKWILVNLTSKRLQAYEGSTPIHEIKVSAGAAETPTVTGMYSIYAKYRSQTMTGYNADGTKYVQPNVEWVSYFYRDYAIHGNYWRPTWWFGEKNGSHGCVGMLNEDAQWIYNWAPIGTTVIVVN